MLGSTEARAARDPLLLFVSSSVVARKLSVAGWGGLRRTAGAMDGAYEPPWTGLRRVLRSPPRPAKHGF